MPEIWYPPVLTSDLRAKCHIGHLDCAIDTKMDDIVISVHHEREATVYKKFSLPAARTACASLSAT